MMMALFIITMALAATYASHMGNPVSFTLEEAQYDYR